MGRKAKPAPDLGRRVPAQAQRWRLTEAGTVDLLIPRYGRSWIGRWLGRRLRPADIQVRLDARGSAVWQAIDGRRTVAEIAAAVAPAFEGDREHFNPRLAQFLEILARDRFIRWVD
ncbi:MAG: PqqD family peptide modification chaperone [Planctomycetes bacterium]|nr:PqqD family peptide modification chaperone [Planctomycetota bacterium]